MKKIIIMILLVFTVGSYSQDLIKSSNTGNITELVGILDDTLDEYLEVAAASNGKVVFLTFYIRNSVNVGECIKKATNISFFTEEGTSLSLTPIVYTDSDNGIIFTVDVTHCNIPPTTVLIEVLTTKGYIKYSTLDMRAIYKVIKEVKTI